MRKTRLGSVWLAMVLLVLACGTAFAQLDLVIRPECIECCPLDGLGPCPGYMASITSRGWESGERLNLILTGPGPSGPFGTFGILAADERGVFELELIFFCQNPWLAEDEASSQLADKYWWIHPDWSPADYGRWKLDLRGKSGSVEGQLLFAEDCVAAEFVPEPGTILLLGTGLAGATAYAALRGRSRRS